MTNSIVILIFLSLFLFSCSTLTISEQDEMLVWEGVKSENPLCSAIKKPELIFSNYPLYINIQDETIEVMGRYVRDNNTIVLTEWADIKDYEHECRHACNDDKWDKYYHSWYNQKQNPIFLLKDYYFFNIR
jgi:hypothetical protein